MKKISLFFVLLFCMVCAGCASHYKAAEVPYEGVMVGSAPQSEPTGGSSQQPTYGGGYGDGTEEYIEVVPGVSHTSGTHSTHQSVTIKSNSAKPAPIKKPSIFSASNIADQLSSASFGYSVPKEANIDDEIEVTVKLNPSLTPSEIKNNLPEGQQSTQTIKVSKIVQIKVESRSFDVQAITPERQGIDDLQDTTWKWSLKPLSSGPNKEVKITVTAIVTVDGEKVERYLDTYVGTVKVNITPKQRVFKWLSTNWEWAWGSLLIPIAGYAWALRSRKKSKKKK